MPGRIDQIQQVSPVAAIIIVIMRTPPPAGRLRLDGDPPFPLHFERVQHLLVVLAALNGAFTYFSI